MRRRIHTTKGEAGVLGLEGLSRLCHATEDLLKRSLPAEALTDRLLMARDWMAQAVEAYAGRHHPETPVETVVATLLAPAGAPAPRPPASVSAGRAPDPPMLQPEDSEADMLFEAFREESTAELRAVERRLLELVHAGEVPAEALSALARVLQIVESGAAVLQLQDVSLLAATTVGLINSLPPGGAGSLDPLVELLSESTAMLRRLLDERQRVRDRGQTVQLPPGYDPLIELLQAAAQGELSSMPSPLPAQPGARLGEILTAQGAVSAPALREALSQQQGSGRRLGEQLVEQGLSRTKDVARALRAQQRAATPAPVSPRVRETVKVDLERVDELVELVGEMVTVESMVSGAPELGQLASPRLHDALRQLTKTTRDLQQMAMQLRMVPLRGLFQRMARTARDVARRAGCSVRVEISGETTEMDRSMVERLADPLIHLVRNAVDHGIEAVDVRVAAGKPPVGVLRLAARHEGGAIVVEVSDDGAGLNRARITNRAIEQGLLAPDAEPTDEDLWQLIFRAGFSTAAQLTEISGRGVGLDVVRQNLERMHGRIRVLSEPGAGALFRMVLPLTLAVIDGMVVACGGERYILPTLAVLQCVQPTRDALVRAAARHELLRVRDDVLPLLRLGDLLAIPGARRDPSEALVVILESADGKLGLLVDAVVTQQQVVIKNLGGLLGRGRHFSGSAILFDGAVALILDPDELLALAAAGAACCAEE